MVRHGAAVPYFSAVNGTSLALKITLLREDPMASSSFLRFKQQLRSKPAMWIGIATGLGLAAGIAGRIARRRRLRRTPTFVLLEEC